MFLKSYNIFDSSITNKMKNFFFITLLSVISFNCQKEISTENGSIGLTTALPALTTTAITSITSTTSTSGGNITSDGGATVTSRGVCWSTSPNPVVTGNHSIDGNGTGTFTSAIAGLTSATIYYVRAYATNNIGAAYGNEISFTTTTTTNTLPTLTTTAISSITTTTASSGGNITSDGGTAVTTRGVCWSTTSNPVVTGNHSTEGNGIGSFTSSITGLNSATVYYVRAYATNSVGTAYGNELALTTVSPDVYITGAGYSSPQVATIWKNELPTPLTSGSSYATCIFIKDADVYVGGNIYNGTSNDAAIWKNGVPSLLPQGTGVNSLIVSGSDVYAAGYGTYINGVGQNTSIARYWKNGNVINIISPNTYSYLYGIAVKGTDVYVVGSIFSGGTAGRMVATIWKNGVPTSLSNGTNSADATDICINGNDIYVSGQEQIGAPYYPLLWKNNSNIPLSTPTIYGRTGGVNVNNDTVYVIGTSASANGTNDAATVWKNGVASYLPATAPNKNTYATDIKFLGNDVFISGIEVGTGARYWKNGIGLTLPSSATQGQGNSIFVK